MRLMQTLGLAAAFACAASGFATPALATAGFTDPAVIDLEVARFTGSSIGAPGGARLPVDRRLKLARCGGPLALEWYGQRRDTVLVRCSDTGSWRIYVPVETGNSAPAARQAPAVVKGENVTVTVRGQGFSLSRAGEALDAGAVGDWIRVRPAGNAKAEPIRGRVIRPGVVGMYLP